MAAMSVKRTFDTLTRQSAPDKQQTVWLVALDFCHVPKADVSIGDFHEYTKMRPIWAH
tara:strand:+ start:185 stop:358 length:174 start_codon:yes stop_codon:yes gene_type:complete